MWPFVRSQPPFVLNGSDICLRFPCAGDYEAWSQLRQQSHTFLQPWEPVWPHDDLKRVSFEHRLHRYSIERSHDTGYTFFLFRSDGVLLGGISLSNVRRGVAQSAMLGYWVGSEHAQQGWMTKGVQALLPYAFFTLHLHRVEAACLPHNTASVRLLEKAGFVREGYARRYLSIAGQWQDHFLYALIGDEYS
jgi:ribosomal-protein-alanine N-acetyltransferase